ncbi:hypothetical protein FA13DRAFT_1291121 [Coprinellus micaceus]|uniref:Uncharacterized protein n=1 Tax=Coprinellus micaceus TaxID=71717 RepID=A0A4Y7R774_COPMI|nr:hypothetical protein FA13DRAFT_1291121 [Coprinellus micaceus]
MRKWNGTIGSVERVMETAMEWRRTFTGAYVPSPCSSVNNACSQQLERVRHATTGIHIIITPDPLGWNWRDLDRNSTDGQRRNRKRKGGNRRAALCRARVFVEFPLKTRFRRVPFLPKSRSQSKEGRRASVSDALKPPLTCHHFETRHECVNRVPAAYLSSLPFINLDFSHSRFGLFPPPISRRSFRLQHHQLRDLDRASLWHPLSSTFPSASLPRVIIPKTSTLCLSVTSACVQVRLNHWSFEPIHLCVTTHTRTDPSILQHPRRVK